MSNMNLLCFNLDSCTQSHPFSFRAFETFWAGDHKLQQTAKKNRNEWIQNEGQKRAEFIMKFKNEKMQNTWNKQFRLALEPGRLGTYHTNALDMIF